MTKKDVIIDRCPSAPILYKMCVCGGGGQQQHHLAAVGCLALPQVVNFTNIFQAAFASISFRQKIMNPYHKHRKAA